VNVATAETTQQKKPVFSKHQLQVALFVLVMAAITVYCAIVGASYYLTPLVDRPFNPGHQTLRPGGVVGIRLGLGGLALFIIIYLYPLRKRWKFMRFVGSTKEFLDYHIVLGLCAPVWIAMHAAFKFRGMAGVAFWVMLSVVLSGVIGRYLYSQIPRTRKDTEFSMVELEHLRMESALQLETLDFASGSEWNDLMTPVSREQVRRMSLLTALWCMLLLDLKRPFQIASVRRQNLNLMGKLLTLGGFVASRQPDLERVIKLARRQSWLSAKIFFLDRASQIFHLWHVIHRPFSYAFLVMAILHIGLVAWMGFL
jgi:hypothetical protein